MSRPEVVDLEQFRRTRHAREVARQWHALLSDAARWGQRLLSQPRREVRAPVLVLMKR